MEDFSLEVGSLADGILMVFFYVAVGLILSFCGFILMFEGFFTAVRIMAFTVT